MSCGLELVQILLPECFLVLSQLVEGIPGVDAGIVVIIEEQLNGIVTDLVDTIDVYILFTELQFFLPGPHPLVLRCHPKADD